MDSAEVKVRCLELAANLSAPSRDYALVLEIASKLVEFTQDKSEKPSTLKLPEKVAKKF